MVSPLFHYDNAINDACEYFHVTPDQALSLGAQALVDLADLWRSNPPQNFNDLLHYYQIADCYSFDLLKWHVTEPLRRKWTALILQAAKRDRARTVLDYGCGIGSDGLVLAALGLDVTLADVDCEALEFATWRARKHNLSVKIKIIDQPIVDCGKPDMVITIDVIEHLGGDWPEILTNLIRGSSLLAITAPFQNPIAVNEFQPQHFTQGPVSLSMLMKTLGWKQSSEIIWRKM